jgi:hypothetical protein
MVHDRDRNYKLQEWTSLESGEITFHKEGKPTDPICRASRRGAARIPLSGQPLGAGGPLITAEWRMPRVHDG